MPKLKISEVVRETIASEMRRDLAVFVIGEEVGVYGGAYQGTKGLLREFGAARVVDTPISELGFAGLAVGAAFTRLRPICEFMTFNFALQALDHVINSAAKTLYMSGGRIRCPIVFRGPNGYAPGVAAQHTQDFTGFFASIPGLKAVAPYSARDHAGLLRSAIRDDNPVVVLEHEVLYTREWDAAEEEMGSEYTLPLDKAIVERSGKKITLVGISLTTGTCLEAAERLEAAGISTEVINMVAINPLDVETVEKSVKKTKRLLIVDNAWPECGVASEISSSISRRLFAYLRKPVKILAGKKVPTAYCTELESLTYPTVDDVVTFAQMMTRK